MADTPLVTGIQLIAVYVTDLDRAKRFYTEVLGFKPETDMPPGLILKSADAMIYLEPGRTESSAKPGSTREVSAIFATESVAAARTHLEEKGVPMVGEYQQFGDDFAFFRFADPDGNVHEFGGKP